MVAQQLWQNLLNPGTKVLFRDPPGSETNRLKQNRLREGEVFEITPSGTPKVWYRCDGCWIAEASIPLGLIIAVYDSTHGEKMRIGEYVGCMIQVRPTPEYLP